MKPTLGIGMAILLGIAGSSAAMDATNAFNDVSVPNQPMEPGSTMGTDTVDIGIAETNSWFSWWPSNLIVAPIPGREPVFGWDLSLFAGVFLDLDKAHTNTPPSSIGVIAWIAENNSYAVGGMGNFNLFNDYVRIEAAAIYMDLNYRFYGVGSDAGNQDIYLDANQQMPAYYANAKYQIFPNGYLGLGYMGAVAEVTYSTDSPLVPPGILPISDTFTLSGVEVPFQYDTRDNQQYPRNGWLVDASGIFFTDALGSDVSSELYSVAVNRYLPMRDRDVIAMRAFTQATSSGTPVFLYSSIGGRQDMRGYAYGRYTDRMAYTLQAEYRWQLLDSWILTGFGGVAEVAPNYGSFFNDILPAAGAGVRYFLSKEYNVTLAFDVAVGRNGTEYYFSLGEAF